MISMVDFRDGAQERDAPIQQNQSVRVLGWTNRPHSFPGVSVQTVQLNCWLQEGASANPATGSVTLVGKEEFDVPMFGFGSAICAPFKHRRWDQG